MKILKAFFAATAVAIALIPQAQAQNNALFTHIAAGANHNLALKADGTVVAWGDNFFGQLWVPVALGNITAIDAGLERSLALKTDGTVVAWGLMYGGDPLWVAATVPAGLTGVVAIAAGYPHNLALKSNGTVVAWGRDFFGETQVPSGLTGVIAIGAGTGYSLALKSDGKVVGWGHGGAENPVPSGLTGVVAIAAGNHHALALKSDGTVVASGRNVEGQSTVPIGLTGVVAIAAGRYHSMALKSDGSVVAWGANSFGQSTVPAGLTGVVAIAAGEAHSLALKVDGTVVGWGDNGGGQLPQPIIKGQLSAQTAAMGVSASFGVGATGIPPLSYQWRKDGTNIIGATDSVYQISNPQASDAGNYSVVITNVSGSAISSDALLTVESIPVTQQPQNQLGLWAGSTASFSVAAFGSPPLSYQWRHDGTDISGATNSTYSLSITGQSDAGNYSVIISNTYGSVTSSNAALTVVPIPPQQDRAPGAVLAWGANGSGQTTIPVAAQSGVTGIAAGGYFRREEYNGFLVGHTLALKKDGTVIAWGANAFGQVTGTPGDYYSSEIASPVTLAGQVLSGVKAVAAGNFHSLALKNDGSVVAWGRNFSGELNVPEGLSGVIAIATGTEHSMALKNDGTVVAWGRNTFGQVTGTDEFSEDIAIASPVTLSGQILSGVVAIAAGGNHSVALKADGSVVAWGFNQDSQTDVPLAALSGVTAIAAGRNHTIALKIDGTVVAWGANDSGKVTGTQTVNEPSQATANPVTLNGQVLSGVTAITAGSVHSVALKNDGSVVAWGQTSVPVAAQSGVKAIAAAESFTVAIVTPTAPIITVQPVSQTVSAWQDVSFTVTATGYALNYQWRKDGVDIIGATNTIYSLRFAQTNQAGIYSVVVSNFLGIVTNEAPAALTVNPPSGTVLAWGHNGYGQTTVPVNLSGVIAVAAGTMHSVALKSDGSVVVWGGNEVGQTNVPVAAQSGVTAIAAGDQQTLALKNDGSVVGWGWSGNGAVTVPAAAQSGVTAIAAGVYHALALKADGSVVAWGLVYNGTAWLPATVPPSAQTGVKAIAAGSGHSVVLKNDGSVVAWGWNGSGQTTVPASAQAGVIAIAAGSSHTVALKGDGSVVAWGSNDHGQTTTPIAAQNGVSAIAAGGYRTAALKSDGTVVEWGAPIEVMPAGLNGVTAIASSGNHTLAILGNAPLQPSLNVRTVGNQLTISWPANAVGFTLQSTPSLSPPVSWIDSADVPAVVNAEFTVTPPNSEASKFFRLRKP